MKEEKLEQLRKVFRTKVEAMVYEVTDLIEPDNEEEVSGYVEKIANQLVYEVKIRINDKQEGVNL